MTRFTLAIAAVSVSVAVLFTSAAEACISCNYVPEVVNTPVSPPRAKPVKPMKLPPIKQHSARPAQKRVAKRPPAPIAKPAPVMEKPAPVVTAKKPGSHQDPVTQPGKTTPIERQADTEGATDTSTAALNEPSPGTSAPKVSPRGGCKKFSATTGKTVTVPCE